jgi:hypothetical protein
MTMGVTMRPDGIPDVYVQDSGGCCDLKQLDAKIRALQQARAWLKKEMETREKENKK